MSQVAERVQFDGPGFELFMKARKSPDWLSSMRKTAWGMFQSASWPDRKSEDWMRSDLRTFHLDRYALPVESAEMREVEVPVHLLEGVDAAGTIQVMDGHIRRSSLAKSWADRGVVFCDLEQAAREHESKVRPYLFKTVDSTVDRFAMLHQATWNGGQFFYVPRNLTVDQPVHVSVGMSDGGTDMSHTLIVLEEGSEATFLYETSSPEPTSTGFHCGALEIVVRPGARLRFVNLQDWGRGVWNFDHTRATVDRDASIQWTIAGMGSKFSQVSQEVALIGEGAFSQVNGVMFTQDRQQMTYNTLQHHCKPHCRSDFLYKSALQDRSRTVWRGMIEVDLGAVKTDGYQRNDNLLLSDQARADSIPGLEIRTDDVRCTHGSTTGKVDEELIFYAQSRGFTRKEATRMIVTGFFQQIFDRITIESVREALGKAISRQVREYE